MCNAHTINILTTFFILTAKQAIREQGLPFQPKLINKGYDKKAYELAMENTKYNLVGKAVIAEDDEWKYTFEMYYVRCCNEECDNRYLPDHELSYTEEDAIEVWNEIQK